MQGCLWKCLRMMQLSPILYEKSFLNSEQQENSQRGKILVIGLLIYNLVLQTKTFYEKKK
jgi:hypothetical protein